MKPAAFEYLRPDDLSTALTLLSEHEDTRILAGGQSLVPMMNTRLARPSRIVDINRIPELDYIRETGDTIAIGALARHADVKSSPLIAAHLPVMVAAYEWVAHAAIRNRGTLCGNLCHADPASEMPAVTQVLGAEMVLNRASGTRRVPATDFFTGLYEVAAAPEEMLTELRIPKPLSGTGWGFEEASMRKGDFAWVTVVAMLRLADGRIAAPAVAATGLGERSVRLEVVERALDGAAPDAARVEALAREVAATLDPPSSPSIDPQYRRDLFATLLPRVIAAAVRRAW